MVLMIRQNRLLPRISSAGRRRRSRQVSAASPTSASTRAVNAIRLGLLLMIAHSRRTSGGGPPRGLSGDLAPRRAAAAHHHALRQQRGAQPHQPDGFGLITLAPMDGLHGPV